MLTITPIRNVKSTINNKIGFTSGPRSNNGADVINNTNVNNEGSFLGDFLGTVKQSPLFWDTLFKRQQSIEEGLNKIEENRINAIA